VSVRSPGLFPFLSVLPVVAGSITLEEIVMETLSKKWSVLMLAFFASIFLVSTAVAEPTYSDEDFPAHMEKSMDKLHGLFQQSFDKTIPGGKRLKARQEYFDLSRDLIKGVHARVMTLDVKKGAALSHTDVLLSIHLLSMSSEMTSSILQEQLADPTMMSQ